MIKQISLALVGAALVTSCVSKKVFTDLESDYAKLKKENRALEDKNKDCDELTAKLQDELASTENQILTARTRFNEAIKPFNNHIKTFPNNLLAGLFDFEDKPYFDADAGAEKPVDVNFDFSKKFSGLYFY